MPNKSVLPFWRLQTNLKNPNSENGSITVFALASLSERHPLFAQGYWVRSLLSPMWCTFWSVKSQNSNSEIANIQDMDRPKRSMEIEVNSQIQNRRKLEMTQISLLWIKGQIQIKTTKTRNPKHKFPRKSNSGTQTPKWPLFVLWRVSWWCICTMQGLSLPTCSSPRGFLQATSN